MNQGIGKPSVAGANAAVAGLYGRGPESKRLASGTEAGLTVLCLCRRIFLTGID
jgi:hypothetical protein